MKASRYFLGLILNCPFREKYAQFDSELDVQLGCPKALKAPHILYIT